MTYTPPFIRSQNFLPNCQWQLASNMPYLTNPLPTKMKENGTGPQTAVTATLSSSYVNNNQPRLSTTNTQEMRVGDIVFCDNLSFWGYSGRGRPTTTAFLCTNRVPYLVANTEFDVVGHFGSVCPSSAGTFTITPIGTVLPSGSGQCFDGWKRSPTLTNWADDWPSNNCPGTIRTLGSRKGSASAEVVYWTCPPGRIGRYQGRLITFGALIKQRVQSGAGTARLFINDGVSGIVYSNSTVGAAYSDPVYGGFEFVTVTARVSTSSTLLQIGLEMDGALNDVYYMGTPTAIFGSGLTVDDLGQPSTEIIRPVGHWNPPLLTPYCINFPSTGFATGLYGYNEQDFEAISNGVCHKTVPMAKCKYEWDTGTAGAQLFIASDFLYLNFGPHAIQQVVGGTAPDYIRDVAQTWHVFSETGKFCVFTNIGGFDPTAGGHSGATCDYDVVVLAMQEGSVLY